MEWNLSHTMMPGVVTMPKSSVGLGLVGFSSVNPMTVSMPLFAMTMSMFLLLWEIVRGDRIARSLNKGGRSALNEPQREPRRQDHGFLFEAIDQPKANKSGAHDCDPERNHVRVADVADRGSDKGRTDYDSDGVNCEH